MTPEMSAATIRDLQRELEHERSTRIHGHEPEIARLKAERDAAERNLDAVGHALGICYDHDHGCGGHGPVEEMVRAAKDGVAARGDAIDERLRAEAAESSLAEVKAERDEARDALNARGLSCCPDLDLMHWRNKAKRALARALAAESSLAATREALRPFAAFVFGPKWAGHAMVERDGDANVLCGYDAEGRTTGVDVNYSDFLLARSLSSPAAPARDDANPKGDR